MALEAKVLAKGQSVSMAKPAEILAIARWKNRPGGLFGLGGSKLDYDLFAHVAYKNGVKRVVKFDELQTEDGAVRHHGDIKTGGEERVTAKLNENIAAIGFSLYSARENGAGSFAHAQAEIELVAGDDHIYIPTSGMSGNDNSYTLYFGTVINQPSGIEVRAAADFSRSGSEQQPVLEANGTHKMDAGPTNKFK